MRKKHRRWFTMKIKRGDARRRSCSDVKTGGLANHVLFNLAFYVRWVSIRFVLLMTLSNLTECFKACLGGVLAPWR